MESQERNSVRAGRWFWICLICILLFLPTGVYLCLGEGEHASGTIHTARPVLKDAEGWNWDYLKEWGEYYAEHFTLREKLVSWNSLVQAKLLKSSPDEDVIVGKDGWLYYASTLDDYLGKETLSDKEISDIVYNLTLLQQELKKQDIPFVFVMAPNKNSLYPQFMPDRYQKLSEGGNAERLFSALEKSEVNFVPVRELFTKESEILYHQEDSHWNNKGAAIVMEASLDALGMEHEQYAQMEYDTRRDFTGDLYGMLYPAFSGREQEIYYQKTDEFTYVRPVKNNYDPKIETQTPGKENACVVFRDSFGNSLLPFIANEFSRGYFSRAVPFPAYQCLEEKKLLTKGKCCCIMEIVERHLNLLVQNAPMLVPEGIEIPNEALQKAVPVDTGKELDISKHEQEGMIKLHGTIKSQDLQTKAATDHPALWVCIHQKDGDTRKYPAYCTNEGDDVPDGEMPFTLYIDQNDWEEDCEIYLMQEGTK